MSDYFDDDRADEAYDRHVSELAHLSSETWDKVRHLPTNLAVLEGDRLEGNNV